MLVMSIHILACLWWLWKVAALSLDEVNSFLDAQPWGQHERNSIHTVRGKLEAYCISIYIATMTLTTVGYGDITADNTWERVGYVIYFIVGAFIWGNLLAELGDIHQSSAARDQEKMERVQKTLEFLDENDTSPVLRSEIIQWVRFNENHHDVNIQKKQMVERLPPKLQIKMMRHLYLHKVVQVPIFSFIESWCPSEGDDTRSGFSHENHDFWSREKDALLNNLLLNIEYRTYTPGETVVDFADKADRMIVLDSGRAYVDFEHSSVFVPTRLLREGDFIGDMALIGDLSGVASPLFVGLPVCWARWPALPMLTQSSSLPCYEHAPALL